MAQWDWLVKPTNAYQAGFVLRVILKAGFLFVLLNLVYTVVQPLPFLSKLTVYNVIIPGRVRFPYADIPSKAYSVTLAQFEGMFASHIITKPKQPGEFRLVLLGDSSVWGWLVNAEETLSACINRMALLTPDGRQIIAYNLGYPALSVFKDALILEESLLYEVDGFVWLVTLQALLDNEQLRHPIIHRNLDRTYAFMEQTPVEVDVSQLPDEATLMDRTLIGQRRDLADLVRYQIYSLGWWMTGIDHTVGEFIGAPMWNLPESDRLLNRTDDVIGEFPPGMLSWDVLQAGMDTAEREGLPMLLVNQPIFISEGLNSDLRYNQYYPRWAYDLYRSELFALVEAQRWNTLDLWNAIEPHHFTDTPFHYDAESICSVAERIAPEIMDMAAAN